MSSRSAVERPGQWRRRGLWRCLGGGGQNPGLAAGRGDHRGQHGRVGVANLAGRGRGPRREQARRRWRGWPRAAAENSERSGSRRPRRARSARRQSRFPRGAARLPHVPARRGHDVFAWFRWCGAAAAGQFARMRPPEFSTCSSIMTASAPAGTGAPVMISQAVAARQRARWRIAGAGGAGDGERPMRGSFRGAAGEAVARGAGEGRLVAVGVERLGEHAAGCLFECDKLHAGAKTGPLRGVAGNQRGGLVVARQSGAGQRRTHAMDCRGCEAPAEAKCGWHAQGEQTQRASMQGRPSVLAARGPVTSIWAPCRNC